VLCDPHSTAPLAWNDEKEDSDEKGDSDKKGDRHHNQKRAWLI